MIQQALRGALGAATLMAVAAASPLAAQQRLLFDWTGRVDSVARIAIHGGEARITVVGYEDQSPGRLQLRNELPRRDGTVNVQVATGHGDVYIEQQPNVDNDYTAIVRVRNRGEFADRFSLSAYWVPERVSAGEVDRDDARADRVRDGDNVHRIGLLHWSGDVDNTVDIRWRAGRALTRVVSGAPTRDARADVAGAGLPARDVTLRVVKHDGRGKVFVVQQPSSGNDYTGIIRVVDDDGGYGHYDFDVVFDQAP